MTAPLDHPNANAPVLWRFGAYCSLIGAAPETILKEARAGRAQLRIVTLGDRGDRYVNREDALAYIETLKSGAAA